MFRFRGSIRDPVILPTYTAERTENPTFYISPAPSSILPVRYLRLRSVPLGRRLYDLRLVPLLAYTRSCLQRRTAHGSTTVRPDSPAALKSGMSSAVERKPLRVRSPFYRAVPPACTIHLCDLDPENTECTLARVLDAHQAYLSNAGLTSLQSPEQQICPITLYGELAGWGCGKLR